MDHRSKEEKAKELEKKALQILKDQKDIYFFKDLAIELGYSREWLNQLGVDKLDSIKSLLLENKQQMKRGMRNRWFESENPTLQVALYKMLADEEELSRLNNNMDVNLNSKGLEQVLVKWK